MRETKWFEQVARIEHDLHSTPCTPMTYFAVSRNCSWHRIITEPEVMGLYDRQQAARGNLQYEARFLRRCHRWLLELPIGALTGVATATYGEEVGELRARLATFKRYEIGVPLRRRPIVIVGQSYFLRLEVLVSLLQKDPDNLMLRAWTCFAYAVNKDPRIVSAQRSRRIAIPASQRTRDPKTGRLARGPDWTLTEEAIIAKWFGRRADGKRHMPSESEWGTILGELRGMRTKASVLSHVSVMNCKLKKQLMVEGYLTSEGLKRFMEQKLGTRTHLPKYRPTPDGKSYITRQGVVPMPQEPKSD